MTTEDDTMPDEDRLTSDELFALRALLDHPPLSEDPVAIRLGLVDRTEGSRFARLEIGSAISGRIPELPAGVNVAQNSDGTVLCTSLSDRVWVVPHERASIEGSLRSARTAFGDDPRCTAVVLYSAGEEQAASLTFAQCFRSLVPTTGWSVDSYLPRWAPLGETLMSFFELTLPKWDSVESLDRSQQLDGISDSIESSTERARNSLVAYNPNLPHRKDAREFVLSHPVDDLASWVLEIQRGDVEASELVELLTKLARDSA